MSNNLITFPFTEDISGTTIPSFPGAYVFRGAYSDARTGLIPIYTSIPNFTANGLTEIMNDKDDTVLVLPGFSLTMYLDINYGGTTTMIDNIYGTDIMMYPTRISASSCKLFYKFNNGFNEVSSLVWNVSYGNYVYPSFLTYDNSEYTLFIFKSPNRSSISSTFTYTGTTDISAHVLVVGGGGSAGFDGGYAGSGGGGAGEVAIGTMTLESNTLYNIFVGGGGYNHEAPTTIKTGAVSGNGSDSYISIGNTDVVRVWGGGRGTDNAGTGKSGGSSGGGAYGTYQAPAATKHNNTSLITYYANIGGNGNSYGGGGGGGAGGAGGGAGQYQGGQGGIGIIWLVNTTYYGGGGAGRGDDGQPASVVGGAGGGGNNNGSGTDGSGGGGGANGGANWGAGGSGTVIIAIKNTDFISS